MCVFITAWFLVPVKREINKTRIISFGKSVGRKRVIRMKINLRDWSLITGRGGLQNGKIAGPKLFAPPPPFQDGVKLFAPPPPPFEEWKLFAPPFNMARTSSFPPFLPPPPPPFVGVELHMPPPPPPVL